MSASCSFFPLASHSKLNFSLYPADESNKLDMAAALPPGGDAAAGGGACADIDVEIDENLFDGDDLDLVEDELDSLDLDD